MSISINPLDKDIKAYVKDQLEKLGMTYIHISDFVQDEWGYENKETGDKFPPTFNWYNHISVCLPEHPNKTDRFVFVKICLTKEDVELRSFTKETLMVDFDNAIETIKDFMDCVCSLERRCELHATLRGSKYIVYKET